MTGGIPGVLPWEDGTLEVRHHGQMTTVGAADTSHIVVGAIGVGRIAGVVVLGNHVVSTLGLGQMELSFAVSHPDAEFRTAQRTEHHAVVLRNAQ